jgi:Zn-dependent membrane protease YugP
MQKHENYAPFLLLTTIVPAVNICSSLSTPLFFLGLIMAWEPLLTLGIILFAASTVFALVTLPVEFNASSRAVNMLVEGGYVSGEEERGMRKVLNAAALTYVAAAVTSLLSLLRLVMLANRRRD